MDPVPQKPVERKDKNSNREIQIKRNIFKTHREQIQKYIQFQLSIHFKVVF